MLSFRLDCKKAQLVTLVSMCMSALPADAEQIKETIHPTVNGSPVTLLVDNMLTQALGGRMLNLDVWAGEFVRYDDNIFYTNEQKTNDIIFSTAAGVLLQAEEKDLWSTKIEAQFQHNRYKDYSEFNGIEGFLHSEGEFVVSPALSARAHFNFDKSYDNVRHEKDIFDTQTYAAGLGVTVSPSPYLNIDVDYGYFGQRREQAILKYSEYDENSISVRPSYAITPNTTVYVQGSLGLVGSKGNWYSDVTTNSAVAGIAWRYRDTANLYGEIGTTHMAFDSNGLLLDHRDGSVTKPNLRIGGKLAITEDTEISAELSYAPQIGATTTQSRDSAYVETVRASATAQYSPGAGRLTVTATPFVTNNKPSNNVEYREYGVTFGTTYCVTDWLNISGGYRVTQMKYADASAYSRQQITLGIVGAF